MRLTKIYRRLRPPSVNCGGEVSGDVKWLATMWLLPHVWFDFVFYSRFWFASIWLVCIEYVICIDVFFWIIFSPDVLKVVILVCVCQSVCNYVRKFHDIFSVFQIQKCLEWAKRIWKQRTILWVMPSFVTTFAVGIHLKKSCVRLPGAVLHASKIAPFVVSTLTALSRIQKCKLLWILSLKDMQDRRGLPFTRCWPKMDKKKIVNHQTTKSSMRTYLWNGAVS